MLSDIDRLRILFALAILKCKPSGQTCFAYVLDLRLAFPAPLPSSNYGQENPWKSHALKLEKECGILKESLEATQIHSFIDTNRALAVKNTESRNLSATPGLSDAVLQPDLFNKKKSKQKQGLMDDSSRYKGHSENHVNLKTIIDGLHYDKSLKISLGARKLFEALDTFFKLASLHNRPGFPGKAFFSATRRSIDALSVSLDFMLKKEMNFNRLGTLDTLLRLVIEKSFPIVASCSFNSCPDGGLNPFDALLKQLQTSILVPIVNSFFPLSIKNMDHLLDRASGHHNDIGPFEQADGRPVLLALFQSILTVSCTTLVSCSQSSTSVRKSTWIQRETFSVELSLMVHFLILETMRHLDQILTEPTTQVVDEKFEKRRRVMRIAVKDTVWYLCSVLHVLIVTQTKSHTPLDTQNSAPLAEPGIPKSTRLRLLKRSILNYLVGCLGRQDRKGQIEETGSTLAPVSGSTAVVDASLLGTGNDHRSPVNNKRTDESYTRHDISGSGPCFTGNRSHNDDETIRPFTPRTHILLDDMERSMVLRVAESYFNTL